MDYETLAYIILALAVFGTLMIVAIINAAAETAGRWMWRYLRPQRHHKRQWRKRR